MGTKHESWVVNVDGSSHVVSFDFSSGAIDASITISLDNELILNKKAPSANDFNGDYLIKIGAKIANLRVKAKAIAVVHGFDVELQLDGKLIVPSKNNGIVNNTSVTTDKKEVNPNIGGANIEKLETELRRIKQLLDDKLISEEEYQDLRKKIMK